MPEWHHPSKLLGLAVSLCSSGLWCSLRQHVFRPRLTDPYLTLGGVLTIIRGSAAGILIYSHEQGRWGVASAHVTPGELLRNLGRAPYVGIAVRTVTDLQSTVVTVCSTCY